MITFQDEKNGLVNTTWKYVRERVAEVEPVFAKMVDNLGPDDSFPLYLCYLPYGALQGDTKSTFLPTTDGKYYRLSDANAPEDVIKHLGYGKDSSPFGMVLEKNFEFFIDLKSQGISLPWSIYAPGSFFSFSRNLSRTSQRNYAPNSILTMTSGARSVFMLPNIGCAINHANLQRDFNIKSSASKSLYEHWGVFKEILDSGYVDCNWRSCILYFSEKWLDKIHNDDAWLKLKDYLHDLAWNNFAYDRNRIKYDIVFSIIQQKRNLKPNPYLADTARHLFATALGAVTGYVPAINDDALPLDILQKVFVQSYGLKKYLPSIIQPAHFKFEHDNLPVYYSLQNPSVFVFAPKSRKVSSTLFEMRELEHVVRIFADELSKDDAMCSDTVINQLAKSVEFKFYHNKSDRHHVVQLADEVPSHDPRFSSANHHYKARKAKFAADAPFVRGCVSISTKREYAFLK